MRVLSTSIATFQFAKNVYRSFHVLFCYLIGKLKNSTKYKDVETEKGRVLLMLYTAANVSWYTGRKLFGVLSKRKVNIKTYGSETKTCSSVKKEKDQRRRCEIVEIEKKIYI